MHVTEALGPKKWSAFCKWQLQMPSVDRQYVNCNSNVNGVYSYGFYWQWCSHGFNWQWFSIGSVMICHQTAPDSKVHGADMGPTWAYRTQVGPMLVTWTLLSGLSAITCTKDDITHSLGRQPAHQFQINWGTLNTELMLWMICQISVSATRPTMICAISCYA